MGSSSDLAIIVPAFRREYLRQALDCLAQQTSQDFVLYVFDDGSPENLWVEFNSSLLSGRSSTKFHRFSDNLGGTSLVAHWNRCVQGTSNEPWLWLFSDDDIADRHCVERFLLALHDGSIPGSVCRFDTATIDAEGVCTEIHPPHPAAEAAVDFAYHRLTLQRRSFAPEYLFQRNAYEAAGGFVDFPFALGSDDASWIVFAGSQPITTLSGAMVYWRKTRGNTSTLSGKTALPKLLALADFTCWVRNYFAGQVPSLPGDGRASNIEMGRLACQWFDRITWSLPASVSFLRVVALSAELHRRDLGSRARWIVRLTYVLLVIKLQASARGRSRR